MSPDRFFVGMIFVLIASLTTYEKHWAGLVLSVGVIVMLISDAVVRALRGERKK